MGVGGAWFTPAEPGRALASFVSGTEACSGEPADGPATRGGHTPAAGARLPAAARGGHPDGPGSGPGDGDRHPGPAPLGASDRHRAQAGRPEGAGLPDLRPGRGALHVPRGRAEDAQHPAGPAQGPAGAHWGVQAGHHGKHVQGKKGAGGLCLPPCRWFRRARRPVQTGPPEGKAIKGDRAWV